MLIAAATLVFAACVTVEPSSEPTDTNEPDLRFNLDTRFDEVDAPSDAENPDLDAGTDGDSASV